MNCTNPPLFLIGESTDNNIVKKIESLGFRPILLPADARLPKPTRSHADMLIFLIDANVFCNRSYFESNRQLFALIEEYGYTVIPCDFEVNNVYPHDIALNQAPIGKYILGNQKFCAKEILSYLKDQDYLYVNIKQGYAKCSTLILNKNAIITADDSIINIATKLGIDVLKTQNGPNEIKLNGYDYGFIGGASAVYETNVYFFGDIELHQNKKEIESFCKNHGFSTMSLSNKPLYDFGGAFILPHLKN